MAEGSNSPAGPPGPASPPGPPGSASPPGPPGSATRPGPPVSAGAPIPPEGARFLTTTGQSAAVSLGLRKKPLGDLYHQWLTASWPKVMAAVLVFYLAANSFFAGLYLLCGPGALENAEPHSFRDAFFFSVQTFATIGYGRMVPLSLSANLVVTVESLTGIIAVAMITGLMFAKFSRPTARVLWSRVVVVAPQDGVPSLMFRMANERGNQVVEANLRLGMVRLERTVEGELVRRVHDLKLVRSQSAVFALSWTAIHRLTPESLLYGETPESLRDSGAQLVAALTGLDETFAQTIHSRHVYVADEIIWGARFADIIGRTPDSQPLMDYRKFHDYRPLPEHEQAAIEALLKR